MKSRGHVGNKQTKRNAGGEKEGKEKRKRKKCTHSSPAEIESSKGVLKTRVFQRKNLLTKRRESITQNACLERERLCKIKEKKNN